MNKGIFLIFTLAISLSLVAKEPKQEKELGWHFYQDPLEVEPSIKEEKKAITPIKQPEKIEINTQWLKENLPKLLNKAMDDPSEENLANYYYAQRLAIDKATDFGNNTKEFFMFEEALSEDNRRPTQASALFAHKLNTQDARSKTLKSLFSKAGLWMFYRSDCGYCHQQFPAMEALARVAGVDVLAISIDGVLLDKQFPNVKHVVDPGGQLSRKFNISITPTTMLVSNDGNTFQPLKFGMASGSVLLDRALYAAKRLNLISEDEFADSQEVKRKSVAEQKIEIDKSELDKNPSILSDLIRAKLQGTRLSTTGKVSK